LLPLFAREITGAAGNPCSETSRNRGGPALQDFVGQTSNELMMPAWFVISVIHPSTLALDFAGGGRDG
jgi:hypothetical protein